MKLTILSQDGNRLIEVKDLMINKVGSEEFAFWQIKEPGFNYSLGIYHSEKRAKEVIKEIFNLLEENQCTKYGMPNDREEK